MSGNVRPSMLNIISRILHKADGSVLVFRRENCKGDTFKTVMQQVSYIIFTLLLPLFVLLSLPDMAVFCSNNLQYSYIYLHLKIYLT